MANKLFPWTQASTEPEPDSGSSGTDEKPLIKNSELLWLKLKKFSPFIGFGALIVILLCTRASSPSAAMTDPSAFDVDVLVVMVPISKGADVLPEILKEVPVQKQSFTKPQLLQLVREQDLQSLRGRLKAKRNLPPNKPLFWSDLDFTKPVSGLPAESPTVLMFSKETP